MTTYSAITPTEIETFDEGSIWEHSKDPLENLSCLVGRCLLCGHTTVGTIISEIPVGWTVCRCGDVVKVENRNRWH